MSQEKESRGGNRTGGRKAGAGKSQEKSWAFLGLENPAEPDLPDGNPDGNTTRVFAVVLLLHVIALGGILAMKAIEGSGKGEEGGDGITAAEPGALRAAPAPGGEDMRVLPPDPDHPDLRQYRVQEGDDLLGIARRFGVSVAELEAVNGIERAKRLRRGKVLLLPEPKKGGAAGMVAQPVAGGAPSAGESGSGAGEAGAGGAEEPPRAVKVLTPKEPEVPKARRVGGSRTYVVQAGDTFYSIARRFGIDYRELMRVNGVVDPKMLQAGQELEIPAGE